MKPVLGRFPTVAQRGASAPSAARPWAAGAALVLLALSPGRAHDLPGHHGPTYEVTPTLDAAAGPKRLRLEIVDTATGRPTAARFSLRIDGREYVPAGLGAGGLRFVSIHTGRKQRFTACYSRGTGPVEVPLPAEARQLEVQVAKGFEYEPGETSAAIDGPVTTVSLRLRRWTDLRARGWIPVEEHAHFDRLDPAHDADWLTMLAGDDLAQAHFLVLRGGNLPGVWASQYAYGPGGEAARDGRLIRPGEEYRDNLQGHINLLGVTAVIEPITTGDKTHPHHWPPFLDVLTQAKELGGVVGPAHGAELGLSSTGVADTILGRTDFFEIANTHLYKLEQWYRLMNCGYFVPPMGGTDLPNHPARAPWQPLLGEIRTYVHTGGGGDFAAFKDAIRRGETFVTSGPLISLAVAGVGPGGIVRLPAGGGDVEITAELSSPRELETFELIRQGEVTAIEGTRERDGAIRRWRIQGRLHFARSAWIAARGTGELNPALLRDSRIPQHLFAHTAAIQVRVGDEAITSPADAAFLVDRLENQIALYRRSGKYAQPADRERALDIFATAIRRLKAQP